MPSRLTYFIGWQRGVGQISPKLKAQDTRSARLRTKKISVYNRSGEHDDEMNVILPWKPDESCPCGNNMLLKDCCLGSDGVPRIKLPSLVPTGPLTGHSNENCYLKSTLNCSTKTNKEHYISRSLLQQLGEPLRWAGLPWEKPGVEIRYGPNSLSSHILCDRHNSALSPLDQLASNAFKAIRASSDELNVRSLARRKKWFLISGEALELWALKTICGLFYASVAARNRQSLNKAYSIDVSRFEKAVCQGYVDAPCGLYVTPNTGQRNPLVYAPLSVEQDKRVIGIRIGLAALEFDVILDPTGVNFDYLNRNFFYRPWLINMSSQRRMHTMVLSWPNSPLGSRIVNVRLMPTKAKSQQAKRSSIAIP